jgi:hypothetical protein
MGLVRIKGLRINIDNFPIEHKLTDFYNEMKCVYCALRIESLNVRVI